jgi:uncharacterized protein HemX
MTDIQNNQNERKNTPVSGEMRIPPEFHTTQHSHIGPILAVLVIMLVLILGGLYLWGGMLSKEARMTEETPIINNEPETPRAVADQEIFQIVSPSDELEAIEADISSTNFDALDGDLMTIDAEMDAALAQ